MPDDTARNSENIFDPTDTSDGNVENRLINLHNQNPSASENESRVARAEIIKNNPDRFQECAGCNTISLDVFMSCPACKSYCFETFSRQNIIDTANRLAGSIKTILTDEDFE